MERLILFAKAPRRGAVKTRLVPPLSPDEALALHRAMLADQLGLLAAFAGPGRTAELCLDGDGIDAAIPVLAGLRLTRQTTGDLGRRMEAALARGHASGTARLAIVGADAPTLPMRIVADAFARLRDGADAVITPSEDGGYVLIATSGRHPALFREIPWGTDAVAATTRRRAADAGIRLDETEPWGDVDRAADLTRLAQEIAADSSRAPATAAALAALPLYSVEAPVL